MELKTRCRFGMWPDNFIWIERVKKCEGFGSEMEAWTPTERLWMGGHKQTKLEGTCHRSIVCLFLFFCMFLFLNDLVF